MRKVLIISPYFPPSNGADMHRIRMSLPYFKKYNWEPTIVTVDERFSEMVKDPLLLKSIPKDTKIHVVKAFSKKWTSKFGLGSIALRSLYHYKIYVDRLLSEEKFDLIYFSTTQFPLLILGNNWKKKFDIPYVIDMQDPWHSDYYKSKPKNERPKKYWLSYRLNKYLEPIAMNSVDGLISVSQSYIDVLVARYPRLLRVPSEVITFGFSKEDFRIAKEDLDFSSPFINRNKINIIYVGVIGRMMVVSLKVIFESLKTLKLTQPAIYHSLNVAFIGTSYAPSGKGINTVTPLALDYGIDDIIIEQTDRIGFYNALNTIQAADALLVPGTDVPNYTASKIFPYIIAGKPLLAVFSHQSSTYKILNECKGGIVTDPKNGQTNEIILNFFQTLQKNSFTPVTKWDILEQYSSDSLTKKQCRLFDQVLDNDLSCLCDNLC